MSPAEKTLAGSEAEAAGSPSGASNAGAGPPSRPTRWAWLTPRRRTLLALGIIVAVYLIMLRGLLRTQGAPMEEGFMLVFPERFLHGDLPNADYLHLYGPGSIWALGGWFEVFGVSLTAERLFGLLQQFAVVFGMYSLARHWGRTAGLGCALISALFILPPLGGLVPLAWVGGVGLGLLGLSAALEGRRRLATGATRAYGFALGAGALAGVAVLFRLDLVVAVGLSGLAAAWGTNARFRIRLLAGFGVAVVGYLIHMALVGPGVAIQGMVLDPVFKLRAGRALPIPPSWSHLDGFLERSRATVPPQWPLPSLTTSQQLFVWFFLLLASVLFVVGVATWSLRRDPSRIRARVLFAAALFGLGLVPQAMQRVDSAHFGWVSCVPVALLPLAFLELRAARPAPVRSPRRASLLAVGSVGIVAALLVPYFTAWPFVDYTAQTFGKHRVAERIERNGRVFYYGRVDVKDAATRLLADIPKVAKPGSRLFVGTTDLRYTPYSDAWFYYLLPEYPPATYYIEMDPGVANAKDSRLARDLRSADIAILSSVWKDWSEPNDSRKPGSAAASRVLRDHFCLVENYGGLYKLYRRCR
jgi:hypothetical protein